MPVAGRWRMSAWNRRWSTWQPLLLLLGALVAGGCGTAPRIEVPSTLPNVTRENVLTLRWALLRQDREARAVGVAEASSGGLSDAVLELHGVDSQGQIVSRGSTAVRPGFTRGSIPFEVRLVETGQETDFRLHVARVWQIVGPGR